jgi:hypothetical protein
MASIGVDPYVSSFLLGKLADHLSGDSREQDTRRNSFFFWHEGVGGYESFSADFRPVHHGGTHADNDVILDPGAVDDGCMPNADACTYPDGHARIAVQDTVVLDVGPGSDANAVPSARSTAPYQTLTLSASWTSATTTAAGAIQAVSAMTGRLTPGGMFI